MKTLTLVIRHWLSDVELNARDRKRDVAGLVRVEHAAEEVHVDLVRFREGPHQHGAQTRNALVNG